MTLQEQKWHMFTMGLLGGIGIGMTMAGLMAWCIVPMPRWFLVISAMPMVLPVGAVVNVLYKPEWRRH